MASQGAKNLIIMSRSGAATEDAKKLVGDLQDAGVQVEAMACDLTNEDELKEKMEDTLKRLPPIRGVIQAAMVLEVCLCCSYNPEAVLTPDSRIASL